MDTGHCGPQDFVPLRSLFTALRRLRHYHRFVFWRRSYWPVWHLNFLLLWLFLFSTSCVSITHDSLLPAMRAYSRQSWASYDIKSATKTTLTKRPGACAPFHFQKRLGQI
jgi:hypothetical protein